MQRAAWARWRSRVYVTPDVFRIALSKFHPIFAQIGHLPQILRQPREIPKYGTYLPLGPYRTGGLLPPLWGTPMCMVPMDLRKRRKGEEAGLLWLGLAARRARLGQAGRLGDTRLGTPHAALLPKLRPPFSTTYGQSLRSLFALIRTGNGLHAACRVLVSTSGHECERQEASASRV